MASTVCSRLGSSVNIWQKLIRNERCGMFPYRCCTILAACMRKGNIPRIPPPFGPDEPLDPVSNFYRLRGEWERRDRKESSDTGHCQPMSASLFLKNSAAIPMQHSNHLFASPRFGAFFFNFIFYDNRVNKVFSFFFVSCRLTIGHFCCCFKCNFDPWSQR